MSKKKKTQQKDGGAGPEISAKLDTLIRLSALNVVKDLKTQKEQIAVLSDADFKPKEIADILRTTSNTVSVTLTEIRKERASAKEEQEKKEGPAEAPAEASVVESKPEVKEDAEKAQDTA
jgi:DNA-directed RNA polymerase specialized sigma24 family protein